MQLKAYVGLQKIIEEFSFQEGMFILKCQMLQKKTIVSPFSVVITAENITLAHTIQRVIAHDAVKSIFLEERPPGTNLYFYYDINLPFNQKRKMVYYLGRTSDHQSARNWADDVIRYLGERYHNN